MEQKKSTQTDGGYLEKNTDNGSIIFLLYFYGFSRYNANH